MRILLLAALAAISLPALAQEVPAVRAARAHFEAPAVLRASSGVSDDDVAGLRAVEVRPDARTGLTVVTFVQSHDGVEVFGTASSAAVRADGSVAAPPPRFVADLAERAGPSTPAVGPEAAAATAEVVAARHAERLARAPRATVSDDPALDRPRAAAVEAETPRLGYHAADDGSLRLAWEVVVQATSGPALLRAVRVDAQTGAVLSDLDLVVHDTWPEAPPAAPPTPEAPTSLVFVRPAPEAQAERQPAGRAPAYRVIPAPFESPNVGGFALVTSPADPKASPLGWHNDGLTTYTVTRGNNAHAYTDADDNNAPDLGSEPNGGPGLVFDFPFDPDASPAANAPAAVTNLFYWTNVSHDVLYRYGFDERAGNFQVTNLGGAGVGNDPVLAEALDGSGTNNANFSTPPEGRPARMQMFRWSGTTQLSVTAPSTLAGPYPSAGASFGPGGSFSGDLVAAVGPAGQTTACSAAEVAAAIAGTVALIERGGCTFVEKVSVAEAAGAIGVVIYNRAVDPATPGDNGGDVVIAMGGDDVGIGIPSVFTTRSAGLAFRSSAAPVRVAVAQLADRDSGLDAGVVVHEYAHGLSNRLVGGPERVACLTNGFTDAENPANNRPGEQMGEGWSDIVGLLLTQRSGDTGGQARGVGTYLRFQTPDGRGIRNAPYSTDFTINDYTYQDVISSASHTPAGGRGLSIPHGVGFVWASMLWDMTWALIDAHGFSEEIADASGRAGNQIALNLIVTGLKLTPCTPGFVDGRDAILAADQALYGGAHTDLIWGAFARRGLGVGADQGAPTAHTDGRANFVAPGAAGAVSLAVSQVATTIAPGRAETVAVELFNASGSPQPYAVGALPPWVRVSPASGTIPAAGSATLQVTLQPAPLDAGRLVASVPITVGEEAARVVLSVTVDTDEAVDGHSLSVVGPNPTAGDVRFTLATERIETVRLSVFDAVGRLVQLRAVQTEPGIRTPYTVRLAGLPSGVYLLRIAGETFAETRTVTLTR